MVKKKYPSIFSVFLNQSQEDDTTWQQMMKLPNLITFIRILIALFGISRWHIDITIAAMAIATGLSLDALDGFVARKRKQITAFGKMFDPIADKIIVYAAFGILFKHNVNLFLLGMMFALDVISTRMHGVTKRGAISYGKWKFCAQCGSLITFGISHAFQQEWCVINGNFFLTIAVMLGFLSISKRIKL